MFNCIRFGRFGRFGRRKKCYNNKYIHYHATIIQLGWLGSSRYRHLLKKKLKRRRNKDYKHYAAITIQCAWFKSRLYKRLFIREINKLMDKLERVDPLLLDIYINGIEHIISSYSSGIR
jgi:hypothetical protein